MQAALIRLRRSATVLLYYDILIDHDGQTVIFPLTVDEIKFGSAAPRLAPWAALAFGNDPLWNDAASLLMPSAPEALRRA